MGKLINYLGSSKILKKIADFLNVTDVKVNGTSVVDANGVADIDLSLYVGIKVVQILPQTGEANFIYLVPSEDPGTENVYDEYVWAEDGWELIGSTEIDLSDYYTKTESDNRYVQPGDLAAVATSGDYDDLIDKPTITDEKVKQTNTTDSAGFRVLLSKSANDTEETAGVYKNSALRLNPSTGNLYVDRDHSETTVKNEFVQIGNSKANGTAGANAGSLVLYGKGIYYGRFYDNSGILTDNRTYQLPDKNGTLAMTDDAEKVKQVYTNTSNTNHYFIGSNSDSEADETATVKKIKHAYLNGQSGHLILNRKHTSSSVSNQMLQIGNEIPDGTAGAVDGYLRLYGKGAYYFQFYDGNNGLTGSQTYRPRNRSGVLGLLNDIWDNSMAAQLDDFNLINPPYYHASGTYGALDYSSNEETGDYTVKGSRDSNLSLNIKRYTQGLYLPAGAYKISGCPSGGSSDTYELRVYTSTEGGSTTLIGSDTGSGFNFQLKETSLMHIVFFIKANVSVDFTFRPTLKKTTDWVYLDDLTSTAAKDINVQGVSEICVQWQPLGAKIISNIFSTRVIKANGSPSVPGITTGYPYQVGVYIQGTTIGKEITARMKISNDVLHIDCPDLNASNNERVTIYGKY